MISKHEDKVLSNKLIECLRQIAGHNSDLIHDSLEILHYAKIIQAKEGGDPLIVKASAIFSQVYKQYSSDGSIKSIENTAVQQKQTISDVLNMYEVDNERIRQIFQIIEVCQSDKNVNSLEFNIVSDSCRLALFHRITRNKEKTEMKHWKTETGYQLAQERFEK